MLKIINNLSPFFEDCYRRINVREYAKLVKISPPTASKLLDQYNKEGILNKEEYKNYLFFYANKNNRKFIDLSRIYWNEKLKELISYMEKELTNPAIILFGSVAKGEVKKDSDIDLALFSNKKIIDISNFERKLNRNIQIFWFKNIKEIESEELRNNILNGYILSGRIKL